MKSFAMFREGGAPGWSYGPGLDLPVAPASRRRLVVFGGVFVVALLLGLTYTFARPAQYRAAALLQITPPAALGPAPVMSDAGSARPVAGAGANVDVPRPLLDQIQVLTSRPLLEQVRERLARAGQSSVEPGEAPLEALQRSLGATLVEGSQVVQLWALGGEPARLPAIVNTLIEVYTEHLAAAYRDASVDSVGKAREEAQKLAQDVATKRAEVRDFQQRHNIVSAEREEQALLNRVKAMSTALSAANERVVKAEAQLRSLQDSAAAGRAVVRAKDNPTLAGMEQRASQLREELRELERSYAPAYLAMDQQVRAKRARLAGLEEQMRVERGTSQSAVIAEAQEELASARSAADQLQQQMVGERREVQDFSLRFNEYKALREQLGQLELLQRDAQERAIRLEASENARRPQVAVIEWAALPTEVWSPRYSRDAAISVGAALALALFAVWLVEFVRPRPAAPAMAMPPTWIPIPLPMAPPPPALAVPEQGRLALAAALPRELSGVEVAALLAAGGGAARLAVAGLLAGLSAEELLGLRWEDIDPETRMTRVGGAALRSLPAGGAWLAALEEARAAAGTELSRTGFILADGQGHPLGCAELDALLLCAAHDAGLAEPGQVTAAALRHTYVAYLVRQGARFADLPTVLGPLPAASLSAYSALAPEGKRLAADRVDWVYRSSPN